MTNMRHFGRITILSLAFLVSVSTFFLRGQELPSLPKAPEVVTSSLPNGIQYYLVKNTASSGFADFALVQKGRVSEASSRNALTNLQHFQKSKPYQYLAKLGVGYEKDGYVRNEGDATVFKFSDVPVSKLGPRDTVLLMLFDLCELSSESQAIMVAGDIDIEAVKQRMDVFSMMVTPRNAAQPLTRDDWTASTDTQYSVLNFRSSTEARLGVIFHSDRTPAKAMGSIQPLVSENYARQLGVLGVNRLERAFRRAELPYTDASFDFKGSADGPGPEECSFGITVSIDDAPEAVALLARVFSTLSNEDVSLAEYRNARDKQILSSALSPDSYSNADWVRVCTSSYLYGSNLASPQTRKSFFLDRSMDSKLELQFFNEFKRAFLGGQKTLSFMHYSPLLPHFEIASDVLLPIFDEAWQEAVSGGKEVYSVNRSDTLSLHLQKSKSKLKSSAPDVITGGEIWTFANGMRVIFKKTGNDKRFHYAFMLNGGLSEFPDLKYGEAAYVSDMLRLNHVAGISSRSFYDMLAANGITMSSKVGPGNFVISGSAPSNNYRLLLKSLIALANERTVDEEAFDWYRQCDRLTSSLERKSQEGVDALLDSLMCPGNKYSLHRSGAPVSDDLQQRSDRYFNDRFSHCNDGVIVIIGDIDPYVLRSEFQNYIGHFRTSNSYALRPQPQPLRGSGSATYLYDAAESETGDGYPGLYLAMSVEMPFSAQKYMAFRVAVTELRRRVTESLDELGMYAEVQDSYELYPTERLSVKIFCRPAESRGLPSGLDPDDSLYAMTAVRLALSDLSSAPAKEELISAAKLALISEFKSELAKPEELINAALMRYSAGKDLVSDYRSKIEAVKASDVQELLSAITEGVKVELVYY